MGMGVGMSVGEGEGKGVRACVRACVRVTLHVQSGIIASAVASRGAISSLGTLTISSLHLRTQKRFVYPCDSAHTAKLDVPNERENPSPSLTLVAQFV